MFLHTLQIITNLLLMSTPEKVFLFLVLRELFCRSYLRHLLYYRYS